uniref:Putative secreted peptide n=1 Tax=Anopheles braziliensis TaxID=58242 RepID=A0A2M3ZUF0_9DIPT
MRRRTLHFLQLLQLSLSLIDQRILRMGSRARLQKVAKSASTNGRADGRTGDPSSHARRFEFRIITEHRGHHTIVAC